MRLSSVVAIEVLSGSMWIWPSHPAAVNDNGKSAAGPRRRRGQGGHSCQRRTRQTRLLPAPFDPRRLGQEPDDDDEYEDATKITSQRGFMLFLTGGFLAGAR